MFQTPTSILYCIWLLSLSFLVCFFYTQKMCTRLPSLEFEGTLTRPKPCNRWCIYSFKDWNCSTLALLIGKQKKISLQYFSSRTSGDVGTLQQCKTVALSCLVVSCICSFVRFIYCWFFCDTDCGYFKAHSFWPMGSLNLESWLLIGW